ncbi:hypothetical protein EV646_103103 [Kribbella antiqua]|uniref:Uncharacterized protein n=1 Tax=Kribbella antiqua TaxID=2512217 RepID=A0A4R2J1B5_9ACTN|nr:DUF5946 family protein [Kribbella antiqua]TCO49125.1 hypothetical protein EV646_103103 [Kribbella antiqua]
MNSPDDTHESRRCPGCHADLPRSDWPGETKYNASPECLEVAGQLLGYEIEHAVELGYLHQLRIDAYGAQHVSPQQPPIGPVFALNGLYMYLERGSGNLDVRTAHSIMANSYDDWPVLTPPSTVGRLTAYDVLNAGSVQDVEAALITWADQVWQSWPAADQELIRKLTIALVPPRHFRR